MAMSDRRSAMGRRSERRSCREQKKRNLVDCLKEEQRQRQRKEETVG